jgi:hypothetical protein
MSHGDGEGAKGNRCSRLHVCPVSYFLLPSSYNDEPRTRDRAGRQANISLMFLCCDASAWVYSAQAPGGVLPCMSSAPPNETG